LTGALQRREVICHGYEFTFVVGFLLREPGRLLLYGTESKPVKFSISREYDRRARSSVADRGDEPRLRVPAGTNPRWHRTQRAGSLAAPPIDSPVAQGYSIRNGSSLHVGCEHSVGFHLQRESASRNCPCDDPPQRTNASKYRPPGAVFRQAQPRVGS